MNAHRRPSILPHQPEHLLGEIFRINQAEPAEAHDRKGTEMIIYDGDHLAT